MALAHLEMQIYIEIFLLRTSYLITFYAVLSFIKQLYNLMFSLCFASFTKHENINKYI